MNEQSATSQSPPAPQPVAVRQIIWREIFPWLILVRVFRIAIAPGPLLLATGAIAVSTLGWWLVGFALLPPAEFNSLNQRTFLSGPDSNLRPVNPAAIGKIPLDRQFAPLKLPEIPLLDLPTGDDAAVPFWKLTEPVRHIFDSRTPLHYVVYYALGFLISLVAWSFVGGVITRQALVELATEQPYDWLDSIRYVMGRYLQYLLAPLAPLLALGAMGLLIVPLGWLMRIDIGVFFAGLVWILVIGLGLVAAWLIVGLVFGWPLMFSVVSSKRDGDALQAFSDSFSYVYGKPLHYLFYVLVALFLGGLAMLAIDLFADSAIEFGFWGASWGAGAKRIESIRLHLNNPQLAVKEEFGSAYRSGVWLIGLIVALVQTIKLAAAFSYFFVSMAAVFLLMRHAVDDKEMDEVHLEEDDEILETARRGMLNDEMEIPAEAPAQSAATVAFDTATATPPPPAVHTTEITTPPASEMTPTETLPPAPEKPLGEDDVAQ